SLGDPRRLWQPGRETQGNCSVHGREDLLMDYKYLTRIDSPADLKKIPREELPKVAEELRDYLITVISQVGGHLASSLGAVELTLALHYIFDAPKDKIVWDVGHQAYGHKVLTGRPDRLPPVRQYGGISGFPVRDE